MNGSTNRSPAVRALVRSVTSWPIRERPAPALDRLVRRGGGLLVLTALSMFAGWSLNNFPAGGDDPEYPAERCLRVTGVVRLATGRPDVPGPFLLVQTAWTQEASHQGPRPRVFDCESSERTLPVPPIHNRIFLRRGAVFELTPSPQLARVLDRLFELPSERGRAQSNPPFAPIYREST